MFCTLYNAYCLNVSLPFGKRGGEGWDLFGDIPWVEAATAPAVMADGYAVGHCSTVGCYCAFGYYIM